MDKLEKFKTLIVSTEKSDILDALSIAEKDYEVYLDSNRIIGGYKTLIKDFSWSDWGDEEEKVRREKLT